ncbi:hypothetical protein CROQUDRAFT_88586 [Cronartium quercuum f. sp. fusiforme G11]|uniref:Uncharacterized protein n=1 Tax=Cronartium quercuum f. sp. fusiforme G11 TaxID=708437 RepID=A0A9P6NQ77_9BASI|nr:hypothetical protein CROQUDRAFT_88586 [Cronartium quercuum f. sp. fusiforme G11]
MLNCTGVFIFSDSQAAIRLVNDPPSYSSGQYLAIAIRKITKHLPRGRCKGGSGEQEDPMILKASLGILLQKIKAHFHIRKYNFNPGRLLFTSTPKKIADALSSLEKGHAAINFQLGLNHNSFNAYLYRFHLADSDLCATCKAHGQEGEDQDKSTLSESLTRPLKNFPPLAGFVLHTKRFVFFVSYLPSSE